MAKDTSENGIGSFELRFSSHNNVLILLYTVCLVCKLNRLCWKYR